MKEDHEHISDNNLHEPRCTICKRKLYYESSFHKCPNPKGKNGIDQFKCAKCLKPLISFDGRIHGQRQVNFDPPYCDCESPTIKHRGE